MLINKKEILKEFLNYYLKKKINRIIVKLVKTPNIRKRLAYKKYKNVY